MTRIREEEVYLTELVEQRSRLNDVSYKLIAALALAHWPRDSQLAA